MRIFTPLLLISFLLIACGQLKNTPLVIPTDLPAVAGVGADGTRRGRSPSTQTPNETMVPLPITPPPPLPIPHVSVFLAGQEMFEFLYLAPGYHGAYIHEIGTNEKAILFKPDRQLHGASTIKIAIAVVTMKVTGWDIYTFVPPGQSETLAELIRQMIVDHSDYATNFLIDYVNSLGYNFDDELIYMGIPGFNVNQRLTTARALGLLLEGLGTNTLGLENNQFILDQLAADSVKDTATFPWAVNNTLPGVYSNMLGSIYDQDLTVPETWTIIKYVANDSGIWTTPDGHRFAVVLLGNYGSEADFVLSQSYIKKTVAILSRLDPD